MAAPRRLPKAGADSGPTRRLGRLDPGAGASEDKSMLTPPRLHSVQSQLSVELYLSYPVWPASGRESHSDEADADPRP